MQQIASPAPITRAALWMLGALSSFMAMAIGGRALAADLSTFQILFFRSLIGLAIISLVLTRSGWGQLRTQQIGLHLLRNLVHFGGQFGWFYGLAFISLAEVFALEFTTPVWTAILATLLLGERVTRPRIVAIILGLVGLLVLLRPGFQSLPPAALAVLASAVGYGLSHTLTKRLARSDSSVAILFYMTLTQLPLGLLPALSGWVTPAPVLWPWLLLVGVSALSAHYCLTNALRLADATVVVPMDFLRLPLIALVGFLFYREPIDGFVLLGALIMLLGNWVNIRAERRPALAANQ